MASNLENTINEDHLTCQICLSSFTKPKALPCLHTFCESCLVLYINRDGHQLKDRLLCPTCRTDIKMPENGVVGFPNNHLVISLQHTLSLADVRNSIEMENLTRQHAWQMQVTIQSTIEDQSSKMYHSSPLQPESKQQFNRESPTVSKVISEHGSAVHKPQPTATLQKAVVGQGLTAERAITRPTRTLISLSSSLRAQRHATTVQEITNQAQAQAQAQGVTEAQLVQQQLTQAVAGKTLTQGRLSQLHQQTLKQQQQSLQQIPSLQAQKLRLMGFICPICMRAQTSAESLQRHFDTVHSDDNTAPVEHDEKGFICPICMRSFPASTYLQQHFDLEHSGSNPGSPTGAKPKGFTCPICMMGFNFPDALTKHYDIAHDSKTSENRDGDVLALRQEIDDLKIALKDEKWYMDELKKEMVKISPTDASNGLGTVPTVDGVKPPLSEQQEQQLKRLQTQNAAQALVGGQKAVNTPQLVKERQELRKELVEKHCKFENERMQKRREIIKQQTEDKKSPTLSNITRRFRFIVADSDEDEDSDEDDGYRREVVMRFVVPREFLGRIIGTKGSKIKEIARTTGTRLNFINRHGSGDKEILEITGTTAGIQKAKKIVKGIVLEEKDIHTDTMDVPDYAMGRIIGKGGSTIRALHESTGASITTAKLSDASSDGITLHRISIRGKSDQILKAKKQIEEIVNKITLIRSKNDESPRPSPSKTLQLKAEVVQDTTDTDNDLTPISYETIIEMTVPDKAVGYVIGKGGSRIKRVSEETSAQLIFKDLKPIRREAGDAADAADITDDTSTLVIRGSDTAAEQAVEKIREIIQQLSIITNIPENNKIKTTKQSVMEIKIPQNLMRKVTGPQWSLIREVEEKSNTKIQLRLARQMPSSGELAHRLIIRGGTRQATLQAKILIQELKDAVHIQMFISVKVLHQILGLTGEANGNLQDICRLSFDNAKICVSNAGDETNPTTLKRVSISGKEDDANSLKALLETLVNEAEQDIEARSTRTADGAGPDESADDFLECGCCFDDEVMFHEMGTCGNGHLFCQLCIQRSCEEVIGQGKAVFPCLAADCKMTFSTQELRAILPERLRESVLRIMQSEEIRQADISDLVQCPHCSFGIIMPDNAGTILKCLNPECLKQTCRLCKEPKHSPLTCDQVEKQGETSMRTFVENKMTEAMIRKCYRCGKLFYKIEGCNKMTCPCGAKMCYVCREPITDYSHFDRAGGCPLTSDVAILHTREVTTAGQQAKERFRLTHPDLADLSLINDPLRSLRLE